jgi:allophanate hydrolase
MSIASLRDRYLRGDTTPREVIMAARQRILADPAPQAWITVLGEPELEALLVRLDSLDKETLPLWGIPFAIKDNIDLAGVPTTAGCPAYAYTPSAHAGVVERLLAAGAIPLGKTALDQFATGLVGTRSPWGSVPNAIVPEYLSGGSSSGSAYAVATGQVCFSLGTDTAGSGRVPAAFNGLVGVKPTRGLLSTQGVVPACRSLDCVSIFAVDTADARTVLSVAALSPTETARHPAPVMRGLARFPARIGVLPPSQREFFGDQGAAALYEAEIEAWRDAGCEIHDIDYTPFAEAARLLYDGPWVAEREAAVGAFIREHPSDVLPVIKTIILGGAPRSAADTFVAMATLESLKAQADAQLNRVDAVLLPTAPTCYTRAEVEADPVALNSRLGTYTNFMNLLDYAALAIPAGHLRSGVPFGVTLFSKAFSDSALMDLAEARHGKTLPLCGEGYVPVAVCGAHLEGMALHWQLTQRKAVKLMSGLSAPHYRFYALAGGPPFRPGMVRVSEGGGAVAMEVWAVPAEHFGSFVAGIPAPLGIGKVELADGRWVPGFICEAIGMEGATDITAIGDWRVYLQQRQSAASGNR